MAELTTQLHEHVNRECGRLNSYTRQSIEEVLRKFYLLDDDEALLDDDDMHWVVSELHSDFVSRGLAKEHE